MEVRQKRPQIKLADGANGIDVSGAAVILRQVAAKTNGGKSAVENKTKREKKKAKYFMRSVR